MENDAKFRILIVSDVDAYATMLNNAVAFALSGLSPTGEYVNYSAAEIKENTKDADLVILVVTSSSFGEKAHAAIEATKLHSVPLTVLLPLTGPFIGLDKIDSDKVTMSIDEIIVMIMQLLLAKFKRSSYAN